MKMNKRIKKLWVAALRSGEYEQGKDRLRLEDKFCCLGVLCDLHAKETGAKWSDNVFLGNSNSLPRPVEDWAGLEDRNPKAGKSTLGAHNDGMGDIKRKTFKQIANLINRHL